MSRSVPSLRALLRLLATIAAAMLLLPAGVGCAGPAMATPAPVTTAHMDCETERAPAAPAHDCASDCALACAALPAPPMTAGRGVVSAATHLPSVPASLAHLVRGPAPPPPRG